MRSFLALENSRHLFWAKRRGAGSWTRRWSMVAQFEEAGIRFKYPENWRLEREENESGWTVSVHSPETAFLMLCLREDMPRTDEMAETALEALREEYPDLEAEDCVDSLAG